jgi:hypothetical protein
MVPPADQLDEPVFQRRSVAHPSTVPGRQHSAGRDDGNVVTHVLHQIHGVARDDDCAADDIRTL